MMPVDAIGSAYNRRPGGRPPAAPTNRRGSWARLTAEKAAKGGYYSWTRLEDDGVTLVDPPVTGTDDAKEVNAIEGIPVGAAGVGAVVWLEADTTDDPAEWRFAHGGMPDGDVNHQIWKWNNETGEWEIVPSIEVTVVTDYRVDGVKFQKKTRVLRVVLAGDESDWTDVHEGTECP